MAPLTNCAYGVGAGTAASARATTKLLNIRDPPLSQTGISARFTSTVGAWGVFADFTSEEGSCLMVNLVVLSGFPPCAPTQFAAEDRPRRRSSYYHVLPSQVVNPLKTGLWYSLRQTESKNLMEVR